MTLARDPANPANPAPTGREGVRVMLAGLPGTGKSTLARALAARLPQATVVSKDELRARFFDPRLTPYSAAQDDFVMELMLQIAKSLSGVVFLDGRTFAREYQRQRVRDVFPDARIIECVCAEAMALKRIAANRTHPAVDRTVDLYHRVGRYFAPIAEPKIVVDTGRPLEECVEVVLAAMGVSEL